MKNIVILGGACAGVSIAHRIFKHAANANASPFKITLVAPNTHFYWNMASPRALIPGQLDESRVFLLIATGGEKLVTDLYVPTTGIAPNSSYISAEFLNSDGFVKVDEFFAVKGAKDVYAIGDICKVEPPQFIYIDRQSTFLAKNFALILSNKPPRSYKVFFMRIMGVSIGMELAVGAWGSVKQPNFVAQIIRKNLFLQSAEPTVNGKVGDSML